MDVIFHPEVDSDLADAVIYYAHEAGEELAIEFYSEFLRCVEIIGKRANSFPQYTPRLKRLNFHRFPYHILFEVISDEAVQIVTIKHDRRHPSYGIVRVWE
jgi:toxin ParE1/3/4